LAFSITVETSAFPAFSESETPAASGSKAHTTNKTKGPMLLFFISASFVCAAFILCACAVAHAATSQVMETADSFVAVFDSHSERRPAASAN